LSGEKFQSVSGFGIEQNVMRAVALVDFLATHDPGSRAIFPDGEVRTIPKIDAVNLIGWSRGAVTCFKSRISAQSEYFDQKYKGTHIWNRSCSRNGSRQGA
jgi:hypothetical protein